MPGFGWRFERGVSSCPNWKRNVCSRADPTREPSICTTGTVTVQNESTREKQNNQRFSRGGNLVYVPLHWMQDYDENACVQTPIFCPTNEEGCHPLSPSAFKTPIKRCFHSPAPSPFPRPLPAHPNPPPRLLRRTEGEELRPRPPRDRPGY